MERNVRRRVTETRQPIAFTAIETFFLVLQSLSNIHDLIDHDRVPSWGLARNLLLQAGSRRPGIFSIGTVSCLISPGHTPLRPKACTPLASRIVGRISASHAFV